MSRILVFYVCLQQTLHTRLNISHIRRRFEARDDLAVTVHDELGEVPFNVGFLVPVGILLREHFRQEIGILAVGQAFEALLSLQVGVKGQLVLAVDIGFLHLRESCVVMKGAELMDLFIRTGRLSAELIAGDVDDLKTLLMNIPPVFYK